MEKMYAIMRKMWWPWQKRCIHEFVVFATKTFESLAVIKLCFKTLAKEKEVSLLFKITFFYKKFPAKQVAFMLSPYNLLPFFTLQDLWLTLRVCLCPISAYTAIDICKTDPVPILKIWVFIGLLWFFVHELSSLPSLLSSPSPAVFLDEGTSNNAGFHCCYCERGLTWLATKEDQKRIFSALHVVGFG